MERTSRVAVDVRRDRSGLLIDRLTRRRGEPRIASPRAPSDPLESPARATQRNHPDGVHQCRPFQDRKALASASSEDCTSTPMRYQAGCRARVAIRAAAGFQSASARAPQSRWEDIRASTRARPSLLPDRAELCSGSAAPQIGTHRGAAIRVGPEHRGRSIAGRTPSRRRR